MAVEKRSCVVDVSMTPIHIIASETCGTKSQPWIVEAPVGQKITISLIVFPTSNSTQTQRTIIRQPCQNYGLIVDKTGKSNTTICADGNRRETKLYSTAGNIVEVFLSLLEQESSGDERRVVLRFKGKNLFWSFSKPHTGTWRFECHNHSCLQDHGGSFTTMDCLLWRFYTSVTNAVVNIILRMRTCIHFTFDIAIGCSDIIPPEDAYVKRNGDAVVVGCYISRKSWHLHCEDGKWIGIIGNCSTGAIQFLNENNGWFSCRHFKLQFILIIDSHRK